MGNMPTWTLDVECERLCPLAVLLGATAAHRCTTQWFDNGMGKRWARDGGVCAGTGLRTTEGGCGLWRWSAADAVRCATPCGFGRGMLGLRPRAAAPGDRRGQRAWSARRRPSRPHTHSGQRNAAQRSVADAARASAARPAGKSVQPLRSCVRPPAVRHATEAQAETGPFLCSGRVRRAWPRETHR